MGINAYDGGQDRAINSSGAVSLVFSNVVETIKDDPAQLRNAVYEFARMKLQSEAMRTDPPMNILDVRRLMLALEIAIERVETKLSERTKQEKLSDYHGGAQSPHAEWSKSNTFINRRGIVLDDSDFWQDEPRIAAKVLRKRVRPLVAAIILGMSAAAILGFSLLSLRHPGPASNVAAQLPAEQVAADAQVPEMRRLSRATLQSAPFPLPQVYGVYALSDGQLNELHAIPGRVPDQRVFMSAVISRPSQTILPNGQISFIAFRRDIAGSAPERVTVRLIAKILRAMTFDTGGKMKINEVNDSWTIRSISHDFRVAPVSENPEMLMIRPENSEFVLSPGRYGLVLKGQAYDFTIAGNVIDSAHCLERVEAANGTFYSECKTP